MASKIDENGSNHPFSTILTVNSIKKLSFLAGLYVAPELLQGNQNEIGSKSGDIYSFGIIASVIITMKPAFGIEDVEKIDDIEGNDRFDYCIFKQNLFLEVIRKVKAGRYPPFRPSLDTDMDIDSNIFELIKNCWSETPSERLKIDQITEILSKRFGGNSKNLMDHVRTLSFIILFLF